MFTTKSMHNKHFFFFFGAWSLCVSVHAILNGNYKFVCLCGKCCCKLLSQRDTQVVHCGLHVARLQSRAQVHCRNSWLHVDRNSSTLCLWHECGLGRSEFGSGTAGVPVLKEYTQEMNSVGYRGKLGVWLTVVLANKSMVVLLHYYYFQGNNKSISNGYWQKPTTIPVDETWCYDFKPLASVTWMFGDILSKKKKRTNNNNNSLWYWLNTVLRRWYLGV